MLVKNYTFLKGVSLFLITFFFTSIIYAADNNSSPTLQELVKKKEVEISEVMESLEVIDQFIFNLKEIGEEEKLFFKKYADLLASAYLSADNKRRLRELSPKIYENMLCITRTTGQKALVYIQIINTKILNSEKKEERYGEASKYLETLELPEYSEVEIQKMCNI